MSLATRMIMPRDESRSIPAKPARTNCGCWRRCCSPPPPRSTRRIWRRACRRVSTWATRSRACRQEYATRGVNLVRVGGKWTFRTADDLSWLLSKETVETRKLSRAAIETLAIIAYHQPVTRAEIEEIRGVSTSKGSVDVLLQTEWIKPRGRRKAPGPPGDLWHHGGVPVAFRARRGRRSARHRRAQGLRPARWPPAAWLLGADAVGRSGACATTRTRSSPATSISVWRRPRSGRRRSRSAGYRAIALTRSRVDPCSSNSLRRRAEARDE